MVQNAQQAEGPGEDIPRSTIRRDKRRSLYHPASAAEGNIAPEVYFSEEGATPSGTGTNAQAQPETFTFLREPTPEPTDRREKTRAGVGGGYYEDEDDGELRDRTERRICGFRPVLFWGIVAVTLVVLIGVSVGIGVGVGLQKPSPSLGDATSSTSPSATSTPDPTTSSSSDFRDTSDPTTTSTDPSSTTSTTTTSRLYPTQTSSGSLTCPDADYTLYAVPGSPVRFLRHCDVDMGVGNPGADIRSVRTESMAECMRNCAGTSSCAGAGWGAIGSGSSIEYWCWLKTSEAIDAGFTDLKGWEFAVMQ